MWINRSPVKLAGPQTFWFENRSKKAQGKTSNLSVVVSYVSQCTLSTSLQRVVFSTAADSTDTAVSCVDIAAILARITLAFPMFFDLADIKDVRAGRTEKRGRFIEHRTNGARGVRSMS